MKYSFLILFALLSMIVCSASSCEKSDENSNSENTIPMVIGKVKIKVGSQTFTATLLENSSVKAFKEMLPLTINMSELNNNEKYYDLPNSLPTNSSNPGTIKTEISCCMVLRHWYCFTKPFQHLIVIPN